MPSGEIANNLRAAIRQYESGKISLFGCAVRIEQCGVELAEINREAGGELKTLALRLAACEVSNDERPVSILSELRVLAARIDGL